MWPWDHLAVGYVVYSLLRRATRRAPPSALAVGFVVLGSQLPDLIDKPLGWVLDVLPSGVSMAHSLVFAVPVCLLVVAWRTWRDAPDQGVAFAVGYLLHLPADAYYPVLTGGEAKPSILLWPIVPGQHSSPADASAYLLTLIRDFGDVLTGPAGVFLVAIEFALAGTAVLLWYLDGLPGVPVDRERGGRGRTDRDR